MDPLMKPSQRQSVHEGIVDYLDKINAIISDAQLTPDLCISLILLEQKLDVYFMTQEMEMIKRAHEIYQQRGLSGEISELAIIEYFDIVNCKVPIDMQLGKKVVQGIITGSNTLDYQLDLLRETFKLAFSKPVF